MPFVPFKKSSPKTPGTSSGEPGASGAAPPFAFGKKTAKRRRKTGKVAPAQKQLMNPASRSMAGGSR